MDMEGIRSAHKEYRVQVTYNRSRMFCVFTAEELQPSNLWEYLVGEFGFFLASFVKFCNLQNDWPFYIGKDLVPKAIKYIEEQILELQKIFGFARPFVKAHFRQISLDPETDIHHSIFHMLFSLLKDKGRPNALDAIARHNLRRRDLMDTVFWTMIPVNTSKLLTSLNADYKQLSAIAKATEKRMKPMKDWMEIKEKIRDG